MFVNTVMSDDNQPMDRTFFKSEEQTRRHGEDDERDERHTYGHSEDEQGIDQTMCCDESNEQANDDDLEFTVSSYPCI